jgi:hypothetical protein
MPALFLKMDAQYSCLYREKAIMTIEASIHALLCPLVEMVGSDAVILKNDASYMNIKT